MPAAIAAVELEADRARPAAPLDLIPAHPLVKHTAVTAIVLRDQDQEKLLKLSEELAAALNDAAAPEGDRVKLKGPMPCAINRIAGHWRSQVVMLSADPARLQRILARVRESFELTESTSPSPKQRGEWNMYLDGQWYGLALPDDAVRPEGLVDSLDVSILQNRLLDPILGVKDVRIDKRIDFVGGIRGTEELEKLVNEGKAAVAFSLYPTTIDDLLRVSDAGEIMPPKSTWFEPKLRDGLLNHQI